MDEEVVFVVIGQALHLDVWQIANRFLKLFALALFFSEARRLLLHRKAVPS